MDEGAETILVCEQSSKLVGFVIFCVVLDEASIHNIAVHPEHQGSGLGSALLEVALEQMKQQQVARCLLEVRSSNKPAQALYLGHGFGVDGTRRNYYRLAQGREDALLMSRAL